MHSFARHRHSETSKVSKKETKGLVLDRGWRYDLMVGFFDTFFFRGKIGSSGKGPPTWPAFKPESRCWMWAAA